MALLAERFVYLFMSWTYLALMAKRLHDRGKSALWLLPFYLWPPLLLAPLMLPTGELSTGAAWFRVKPRVDRPCYRSLGFR